jgi:hypothetical protein
MPECRQLQQLIQWVHQHLLLQLTQWELLQLLLCLLIL